MKKRQGKVRSVAMIGVAAFIAAFAISAAGYAQNWRDPQFWNVHGDRLSRIEPWTFLQVRTTQPINSNRADGRVFSGVVTEDVWDDYGRLAVPAIPRGSRVEMIVRVARDGDLLLDLESVFAHGQRYALSAEPERIESRGGRVSGDEAVPFASGGAVLGAIVGAVAGGGKGAAIGAAAGAATGLGLAYQGRSIRVPPGSLLTFRLERGLNIGVPDEGFDRRGRHDHPDRSRFNRR